MYKRFLTGLTFLSILLLIGCGNNQKDIMAKVGSSTITLKDFNARIESLPAHYQDIIKGQKREFLDDLIIEELLYSQALKSGLDKNPETQSVIAEAKKKILISKFIKENVDSLSAASEEDIKKYYDEHSEEFMLPERWRASHILVETAEEALEIKQLLSEGKSFEELARARSLDSSSKKGGDLGFFSKGQLIPDFEKACIGLTVGQTSDIVKSQLGYHIIKLEEKKEPEVQEFDEIRNLIKKELERDRKKQVLAELTNNLKNNTAISVNEALLNELSKKEPAETAVNENKEGSVE